MSCKISADYNSCPIDLIVIMWYKYIAKFYVRSFVKLNKLILHQKLYEYSLLTFLDILISF